MPHCLSEDEVIDFVSGGLAVDAAAQLDLHIDACDACRELVSYAVTPRDASPAMLARYEVRGMLGCGGMGVVYRAHDPDLHRELAIKVLKQPGADREEQLREARALARIAHRNVVAVHDVGTVDGSVFIAMELVAGSSLATWLACGPHGEADVLAIMDQVGAGLAAAHAAGIVHGDVKPTNVLVTATGRVVVIDFGLATAARDPSAGGTRGYMAPEQLAGGAIDPRTDQFAFCVLLREAFGARIPARVRRVIERGLAADPRDRFPDMAALRAVLRPPARSKRAAVLAGAAALVGAAALYPTAEVVPASDPSAVWPIRSAEPVDAGIWVLVGGLTGEPSPEVAAQTVADHVRGRLGRCATAEVAGATVTYHFHGCVFPGLMRVDGDARVTYRRADRVLIADLVEPELGIAGGTGRIAERAIWWIDRGGVPHAGIDAAVDGIGVRGVAYRSAWHASTTQLANGCELIDASASFDVARPVWHTRFDHLERCPGACPRARAGELIIGTTRVEIDYDGSAHAAWRNDRGRAGVIDLACEPRSQE